MSNFKFTDKFIAGVIVFCLVAAAFFLSRESVKEDHSLYQIGPQIPLTYKEAFNNSKLNGKPILVFVNADWCPPCKQMKKLIIPQLLMRDSFSKYNYADVNFDKQNRLAKKLLDGKGLPQLLVFKKVEGAWSRSRLNGFKTVREVENFLKVNQ